MDFFLTRFFFFPHPSVVIQSGLGRLHFTSDVQHGPASASGGRSGQLCDWMHTVYIQELDATEQTEIVVRCPGVDIQPLVSRQEVTGLRLQLSPRAALPSENAAQVLVRWAAND